MMYRKPSNSQLTLTQSVLDNTLAVLQAQLAACFDKASLNDGDDDALCTFMIDLNELLVHLSLNIQLFRDHIEKIEPLLQETVRLLSLTQRHDDIAALFNDCVKLYHQAQPLLRTDFFSPFIVILTELFAKEAYDTIYATLSASLGLLERYVCQSQRALLCYYQSITALRCNDDQLAAFCLGQAARLATDDNDNQAFRYALNVLPHYKMYELLYQQDFQASVTTFLDYFVESAKVDLDTFVNLLKRIESDGDHFWCVGDYERATVCYQQVQKILHTEQQRYQDNDGVRELPAVMLEAVKHYFAKLRAVKQNVPFTQVAKQYPLQLDCFWQSLKTALLCVRSADVDLLDNIALPAIRTTLQNHWQLDPAATPRQHFQARLRGFLTALFDIIERFLGPAPCLYSILSMGSVSQGLACAFSDFEYLLVIDPTDVPDKWRSLIQTYFEHFCALVALIVMSLGEYRRSDRMPETAFKDLCVGFRLDDALVPFKSALRLFGSVTELSNQLQPITQGNTLYWSVAAEGITTYNLLNAQYLYGDTTLAQTYYHAVNAIVSQNRPNQPLHWCQEVVLQLPHAALDVRADLFNLTEVSVKLRLIKPIIVGLAVLRWYFFETLLAHSEINALFAADCEVLIRLFISAGVIHAELGNGLLAGLNFAWELRQRVHLYYQHERESVYLTDEDIAQDGYVLNADEKRQLILIDYYTVQPFLNLIDEFCHPIHIVTNPTNFFKLTDKNALFLQALANPSATASAQLEKAMNSRSPKKFLKVLNLFGELSCDWLVTPEEHGYTPLHRTAKKRWPDRVILKILDILGDSDRARMAIRLTTPSGYTPIHWAVYEGSAAVVKKMLSIFRDTDQASQLINQPSKNGYTPFSLAVYKLRKKGDSNKPPLLEAARRDDLDIFAKLWAMYLAQGHDPQELLALVDQNNNSALCLAALHRNVSMVQHLLDLGANVRHRGLKQRTPLLWAASNGDVEVFKLLWHKQLEDEQAPTITASTILSQVDVEGKSAFSLAKRSGQHAMITYLQRLAANNQNPLRDTGQECDVQETPPPVRVLMTSMQSVIGRAVTPTQQATDNNHTPGQCT